MKKTGSKRGQTKRVARRTNRVEPSSIRQETSITETGEIEDTGAVKEARSSIENVKDVQKTVEETTGPSHENHTGKSPSLIR